ncbi:MAG: hypothetical protein A2X94_03380 [Bdellovibrionales bacterium GWB1_55_8]|nr:MAG: hypothetical protein A2X94_03380 [Bdellovibrionales bacterium GWB1_55_8]
MSEFSFRTRERAFRRFRDEKFDLFIVGGGITGAAVARDAATRGLKVALVDKNDFAWGTSSRSSKLIHGGLRYLQNMELGLVFESLSERAFLLKTSPHMVRPVPFYFPVYQGDKPGRAILGMGMWLYDVLALFRAGLHKNYSPAKLLELIPSLKKEGLRGGFRYFDASMWDDGLTVSTLRAAHDCGAAVANYAEAVGPLWHGDRITGFRVRDLELPRGQGEIDVQATQVVICAGPWTDQVGAGLSQKWRKWLAPSKGVHLVFDLKRFPLPGAVVMNSPADGRIAFAIPRPDFGEGVTIVGTTDGPSPERPESAEVDHEDVDYLMKLVHAYFPALDLQESDILSAYVGVRPLMGPVGPSGNEEDGPLQKVSREHHIDEGPGGTVVVAGGKYTTHRTMAEEIVEFALKLRARDARQGKCDPVPREITSSKTRTPINPRATREAIESTRRELESKGLGVPEELLGRYGSEAKIVLDLQTHHATEVGSAEKRAISKQDPEGFPALAAQLRFTMRSEMVLHLEDFYLRRIPLFLARADHGLPWAEALARVWAEERGLGEEEAQSELARLRKEMEKRSFWSSHE